MNSATFPETLRAWPHWVGWRMELRDGRLTKVPVNLRTGANASVRDPNTWLPYEDAQRLGDERHVNGLGFVVTRDDPFVGIDLDNALEPETGEVSPSARRIIDALDSYTEITPSGRGVRVWVRGTLPPGGNKRGPVEFYDHARFFTVTGQHFDGTPLEIHDRQAELETVYRDIFAELRPLGHMLAFTLPVLDDEAVVRHARHHARNGDKFARLWCGDWSGYSSQSEADLALCSYLGFWTSWNAARVDRLFRQSGLFRAKWDTPRGDVTYGVWTIERAMGGIPMLNGHQPKTGAPNTSPTAQGDADPSLDQRILPKVQSTDLGNARRLVARHGADLRFCPSLRTWLVWDKARWRADVTMEIVRRAKDTVGTIYADAAAGPEGDRRAIGTWALRSEAEARIQAMIGLAESELGIPITTEMLNKDPWVVNVLNGTVDLRTGELRPHRREDLITKVCPIEYDPTARAPLWDAFLARIMAENGHVIGFLQRAVGYSLTGLTIEQVLFILYGTGANGKTTFLEVLRGTLGDYAAQTDFSTFLAADRGGPRNDLARLAGTRFVSAVEMEGGRRLAEVLVKQVTGGDAVTARFLHREFFEFAPAFKLWLAANHKPVIRGTDRAIWRRIRLIPFTVTIPDPEQDRHLRDRLREELSGILRWAVEGCLAWQRQGLGMPDEVREATDTYREESDTLAQFLADRCVVTSDKCVAASDLYGAYTEWSEQTGEKPETQTTFGARLRERGFTKSRTPGSGTIRWHGLALVV